MNDEKNAERLTSNITNGGRGDSLKASATHQGL